MRDRGGERKSESDSQLGASRPPSSRRPRVSGARRPTRPSPSTTESATDGVPLNTLAANFLQQVGEDPLSHRASKASRVTPPASPPLSSPSSPGSADASSSTPCACRALLSAVAGEGYTFVDTDPERDEQAIWDVGALADMPDEAVSEFLAVADGFFVSSKAWPD
uniref:Uncharacterized protein n=1 Tax=Emiliania huxleyi TaxID=2903 RepID=A0A7S3RJP4_EMIHU